MSELLHAVRFVVVLSVGLTLLFLFLAGGLWFMSWFSMVTGMITREQHRAFWRRRGSGGYFDGGAGSASGGGC